MSKITAFIDGSIYSQSVCQHAAWIAGRLDASVELLHLLGRHETGSAPSDLSGNIALGARSSLLKELSELDEQRARLAMKRGRAILEDGEAAVRAAGVEAVSGRLRHGDVVDTVAEVEADSDLLVIGKRGEAADFAKLHLGSNLERVVRASHKPVFVAARAFKPIEKVLVAYDGGASSIKAVDAISRSPLFAGLTVKLLMVGTDNTEARNRLAEAEAVLRGAGVAVQGEVVAGQPETVISERVESENFGLLVMGAYGHSRIRSLIIGSTTTEMLRSCKIPVMLFR
ncbi:MULTISPECIES: universal stress protein [Nitratireductor]|uniref:universal stress protein n=1 Tax=Nitratireductor TaxID=245876 RepID=UPI0024BDD9AE|nr:MULTISPECIES: universal stress protein [Nitratireductor]MDJ1463070.1 universal stress protein [Nitratireductor sp. GZWM139]MDV2967303.1 universal stress protein [Nitratireductor aquimarinus]